MRILLVNYRYFISGGPEKYMFHIKEKLEAEGHEVIPFSVQSNKNVQTPYSTYFVEPIGSRDATYYEECRKTPRVILQMLSRSIYSFEVKKAVKRIITETKPELVYILHFVNKLSPSVIRGAKEAGLPVVLRLSDYFLLCPRFDFYHQNSVCEECLSEGLFSCIRKRCIKGSLFASAIRVFAMELHKLMKIYDDVDAYVAPSEFIGEKLSSNGYNPNKIYHIPTFTSEEREYDHPAIGEYGLYFGRITREKGVKLLVRAYEELPDRRLVIVGDDTTEEGRLLKAYVQRKGITNIEFKGFLSGAELESSIRNARFILIPSLWYDNLPNTALEAFRYAKPVIASRIGSLPELVMDGYNGFLFHPGNVSELVKRIMAMEDEILVARMGACSRRILDEKFSKEAHYHTLMDLFETLLHRDDCIICKQESKQERK